MEWASPDLLESLDSVFQDLPLTVEVDVQWSVCPTSEIDTALIGKDPNGGAIYYDFGNGLIQSHDVHLESSDQMVRRIIVRVAAPRGKTKEYWQTDMGAAVKEAVYERVCVPLLSSLVTAVAMLKTTVWKQQVNAMRKRPAYRSMVTDDLCRLLRDKAGDHLRTLIESKSMKPNLVPDFYSSDRYSKSPVTEPPAEAAAQVFLPNQGIW